MKLNFTYILVIRAVLFVLILLYSLIVFGSTDNYCRKFRPVSSIPIFVPGNTIETGKILSGKHTGKQVKNSFVVVKRKKKAVS